MAMAAQQAAISARQQQQQATLIELEQARVRRALAQYAAAGNINPAAAAAAAAAGVGAAGLSAAATAPPGAALGGIDASNSSALYGRTSTTNPVAPSGAKRPGAEGITAGAPSGGGSQPSTPQPKKQKLAAGIGGSGGEDTAAEAIVVEESKPATSTAHTTHRVLQTGLAGPFVRGVLGDDERTLATFRSQSESFDGLVLYMDVRGGYICSDTPIHSFFLATFVFLMYSSRSLFLLFLVGMGPRYFASQILNLAETPFRKDSIVIKMNNIDKLGLRISDSHSLYTQHAVEITSEEMRRKHEALVSGMEERIKQLEDELTSARSKAEQKSTAETPGDRDSAPMNNSVLQAALKKAEEE